MGQFKNLIFLIAQVQLCFAKRATKPLVKGIYGGTFYCYKTSVQSVTAVCQPSDNQLYPCCIQHGYTG